MPLKNLFKLLLVLATATLLALAVIDEGLKVPNNPIGIVSFEFCGFSGQCAATLAEWGTAGRELAMLSLGLDYLFLLLYAGLICVGLLLLAERLPSSQSATALNVARLAWFASIADAVENFLLVQVIRSDAAAGFGEWAGIFASLKFLVFFATLGCLIYFWRVAARARPATQA